MNVNNATNISVQYRPEFFDSDFRFGLRQVVSFDCWDSDITNNSVIAASLSDIQQTSNKLDFEQWSINGITIENAQITSFSIDQGEWVAGIKYRIELLNYLDGTVEDNLGGSYYQGLDFDGKSKYLTNFSESFNFDLGENSMGYNHTVTYQFSKALNEKASNGKTGLEISKELANKALKGGRPDFGFSSPVPTFAFFKVPAVSMSCQSTSLTNRSFSSFLAASFSAFAAATSGSSSRLRLALGLLSETSAS